MQPLFVLILTAGLAPAEPEGRWPEGRLLADSPAGARFAFHGLLGARIDNNIANWLLIAPHANPGMLEMFRVRDRKPEPQVVPWAGEFIGKYLISAIQALRLSDRPELREHVQRVVAEFISTQDEDGYLGPFPKAQRLLGNWDLWGHYHAIEALLLWHDESGDPAPLEAAKRTGGLICKTYLDGGRRVFDAGSHEMNMAVIHGLGMLYRRAGNERYLRMMHEIEKDWERAGDYFRQGLEGADFYRTPRPRWESLHDVQGLVELYRITGDEHYRTAFINLWRSIARLDRHNTGGFSSGEQAVGHPYSNAAIETCCTIAWMALTFDMLRLTADPAAADELELSTWNGMLGAQHPTGRWWTYNTPMNGVKEASAHAIVFQSRAGTPELNCCSVNGPRGLGMLSEWAVLADGEGPLINFYGDMDASFKLKVGTGFGLVMRTAYPRDPAPIHLILRLSQKTDFNLRLRIPAWSRETSAALNGQPIGGVASGKYFSLRRAWSDGDEIVLQFDGRLRLWAGDREQSGKISLFRGPILLAWDQRWNPFDEEAIPAFDARRVSGMQAASANIPSSPFPPLLLVSLPAASGQAVQLCDFATAGAAGTRYRSWLPAVNVPPPPVFLERPRNGEKIPPGKALFTFQARRRSKGSGHTILLAEAADFAEPIAKIDLPAGRAVLDLNLQPGRDYFWKVAGRNDHGASESEARSFRIDPALPPLPESVTQAPAEGPEGLLIRAELKGDPKPAHGALIDAGGVSPASGPSGAPGGALAFDGEKGRIRYAIPNFPEEDCTACVKVAAGAFPQGRIAQVFSAWALPMDDPLRLTIDGGKVFARIEAGQGYSTAGVPLKLGEWTHLAAVKAGAKLTLYVNGEARSSAEVPTEIYSVATNVALGGNPNFGGNEFLKASLADFRLYARALGPEEVRRLAAD